MISGGYWRLCVVLIAALAVSACGGGRLGLSEKGAEEPQKTAADRSRPNTPKQRTIQVASTAARASYCAFGMDREQLRADYFAYEREQGASPETMEKLKRLYDATYRLFSKKVRQISDSCSSENIEEIRPHINRHLEGDYTPAPREPEPTRQADVELPDITRPEDQVDITSGGIDNKVWEGHDTM